MKNTKPYERETGGESHSPAPRSPCFSCNFVFFVVPLLTGSRFLTLAYWAFYRLRPSATTMLCRSCTGKAMRLSTQRLIGPARCRPIDSSSGVNQPPR